MTRKIGFAFPGQGSQSVGMLAEHFDTSKTFNHVFDISKEVLGTDFKKLIEEGTSEDLAATQVTQPLLLTANYAESCKYRSKISRYHGRTLTRRILSICCCGNNKI